MSDVTERTIGSLLSEHFSGAWGAEPRSSAINTTVLRSTDIDDEGHVDLARGARRLLSPRERSMKRLRPGDILLEASGGGPGKPVGRPAWFSKNVPDGEFATSNFFRVLRPDGRNVDPKFLLWVLLRISKRPEIWRFQQQTTGIINLKFSDYLNHRIEIPDDLAEQRRIAEILDAMDEQVAHARRALAKLAKIRRGLLKDLLLLQPRSLTMVRVGFLGDFVEWLSGGTPAKSVKGNWDGPTLWVTPKDMKSDLLSVTADSLTPRGVASGSRIAPQDAVFIVVRGMILAHTFPVSRTTEAAAFNQDVKALMPRAGLQVEYLKYWLIASSDDVLRRVGESTHGTKKLDLPDLKAMTIVVPPESYQEYAVTVLHSLDRQIELEEEQLRKLMKQRVGLIDDLLSANYSRMARAVV